MRALLSLALLLAVPAGADIQGRGQALPSLTVAGRTFTDLTNLKILEAWLCSNTAARYSTFRANDSATGYQVTAGKALYIEALKFFIQGQGASGVGNFVPAYGTSDVNMTSASAPTGIIYPINDGGTYVLTWSPGSATITLDKSVIEIPFYFKIPAQKFPAITSQGTSTGFCVTVQAYGYEK